jgi:hypothetical protein
MPWGFEMEEEEYAAAPPPPASAPGEADMLAAFDVPGVDPNEQAYYAALASGAPAGPAPYEPPPPIYNAPPPVPGDESFFDYAGQADPGYNPYDFDPFGGAGGGGGGGAPADDPGMFSPNNPFFSEEQPAGTYEDDSPRSSYNVAADQQYEQDGGNYFAPEPVSPERTRPYLAPFESPEQFLEGGKATHPDERDAQEEYDIMLGAVRTGQNVEQAIAIAQSHLSAHDNALGLPIGHVQNPETADTPGLNQTAVDGFIRVIESLGGKPMTSQTKGAQTPEAQYSPNNPFFSENRQLGTFEDGSPIMSHQEGQWDQFRQDGGGSSLPTFADAITDGPSSLRFNPDAQLDPSQVEFRRGFDEVGQQQVQSFNGQPIPPAADPNSADNFYDYGIDFATTSLVTGEVVGPDAGFDFIPDGVGGAFLQIYGSGDIIPLPPGTQEDDPMIGAVVHDSLVQSTKFYENVVREQFADVAYAEEDIGALQEIINAEAVLANQDRAASAETIANQLRGMRLNAAVMEDLQGQGFTVTPEGLVPPPGYEGTQEDFEAGVDAAVARAQEAILADPSIAQRAWEIQSNLEVTAERYQDAWGKLFEYRAKNAAIKDAKNSDLTNENIKLLEDNGYVIGTDGIARPAESLREELQAGRNEFSGNEPGLWFGLGDVTKSLYESLGDAGGVTGLLMTAFDPKMSLDALGGKDSDEIFADANARAKERSDYLTDQVVVPVKAFVVDQLMEPLGDVVSFPVKRFAEAWALIGEGLDEAGVPIIPGLVKNWADTVDFTANVLDAAPATVATFVLPDNADQLLAEMIPGIGMGPDLLKASSKTTAKFAGKVVTMDALVDDMVENAITSPSGTRFVDAIVTGGAPTKDDLLREFDELSVKVRSAEKTPNRAMSPEESQMMVDDWKAYSRSRGYTEEEISDFERFLQVHSELRKQGVSDDTLFFREMGAGTFDSRLNPAPVAEKAPTSFFDRVKSVLADERGSSTPDAATGGLSRLFRRAGANAEDAANLEATAKYISQLPKEEATIRAQNVMRHFIKTGTTNPIPDVGQRAIVDEITTKAFKQAGDDLSLHAENPFQPAAAWRQPTPKPTDARSVDDLTGRLPRSAGFQPPRPDVSPPDGAGGHMPSARDAAFKQAADGLAPHAQNPFQPREAWTSPQRPPTPPPAAGPKAPPSKTERMLRDVLNKMKSESGQTQVGLATGVTPVMEIGKFVGTRIKKMMFAKDVPGGYKPGASIMEIPDFQLLSDMGIRDAAGGLSKTQEMLQKIGGPAAWIGQFAEPIQAGVEAGKLGHIVNEIAMRNDYYKLTTIGMARTRVLEWRGRHSKLFDFGSVKVTPKTTAQEARAGVGLGPKQTVAKAVQLKKGAKVMAGAEEAVGRLDHILENMAKYDLSKPQKIALTELKKSMDSLYKAEQAAGIDYDKASVDYFARVLKEGPKGETPATLNTRSLGRGRSFTQGRSFSTIEEAYANGFRYHDPFMALESRYSAGLAAIANARSVAEMKHLTIPKEARVDPIWKAREAAARTELANARKAARGIPASRTSTPLQGRPVVGQSIPGLGKVQSITKTTVNGKTSYVARIGKKDYPYTKPGDIMVPGPKVPAQPPAQNAAELVYWENEIKKNVQGFKRELAAVKPKSTEVMFQNQIVPAPLVKEIQAYWDFASTTDANTFEEMFQLQRSMMTGFDLSAALIQGYNLLVRNPVAWLKTIGLSMGSLVNDDLFYGYMARNTGFLDKVGPYSMISTPSEYLAKATETKGMFGKAAHVLSNLPVFSQSQTFFERFITIGQTELGKGLYGAEKRRLGHELTQSELKELASVVRKQTGSTLRPGLTKTMRSVQSWLLFAPSYYGSFVGTLVDAAKFGPEDTIHARQARQLLMNTLGGSAALVAAAQYAQGEEINITDPFRKDFFGIKVGDGYMSPLGPWKPYLQTAMSLRQHIMDKDLKGAVNDAIFLGRSRTGVGLSAILDLVVFREDVMGEKIPGGLAGLGEYIKDHLSPLGAKDALEGADWARAVDEALKFHPVGAVDALTEGIQRSPGQAASVTGARNSNMTPYQILTGVDPEKIGGLRGEALEEYIKNGNFTPEEENFYRNAKWGDLGSGEKDAIDAIAKGKDADAYARYDADESELKDIFQGIAADAARVRSETRSGTAENPGGMDALFDAFKQGGDPGQTWEQRKALKNYEAGRLLEVYNDPEYQELIAGLPANDLRVAMNTYYGIVAANEGYEDANGKWVKAGMTRAYDWDTIEAEKAAFLESIKASDPVLFARLSRELASSGDERSAEAHKLDKLYTTLNDSVQPYYDIVERLSTAPDEAAKQVLFDEMNKLLIDNPGIDRNLWMLSKDGDPLKTVAGAVLAHKSMPNRPIELSIRGEETLIPPDFLAVLDKHKDIVNYISTLNNDNPDGGDSPMTAARKADPVLDAIYFKLGLSTVDKKTNTAVVYNLPAVEKLLAQWGGERADGALPRQAKPTDGGGGSFQYKDSDVELEIYARDVGFLRQSLRNVGAPDKLDAFFALPDAQARKQFLVDNPEVDTWLATQPKLEATTPLGAVRLAEALPDRSVYLSLGFTNVKVTADNIDFLRSNANGITHLTTMDSKDIVLANGSTSSTRTELRKADPYFDALYFYMGMGDVVYNVDAVNAYLAEWGPRPEGGKPKEAASVAADAKKAEKEAADKAYEAEKAKAIAAGQPVPPKPKPVTTPVTPTPFNPLAGEEVVN